MPSPDARSVDLPIAVLGGRVTQFDPQALPQGASPFNRDVIFSGANAGGEVSVGGVGTRPGMQSLYAAFANNPAINYVKTFVDSSGAPHQLLLDSLGLVRDDFPEATFTQIGTVVANAFAQSDTYAGREWLAIGDGKYGIDIPRDYDGTFFDRVSQIGPGAAPTAVDGAAGNISAGLHQVSVCFQFRSGYISAPAPPSSWTAAGSKKVNLTVIATGPPNVVARIVIFTPVIVSPATAGPFFYLPSQVTAGSATFPTMVIPDNTTVAATFDFLDAVLQAATPAGTLFNLLELGECSSTISYSERTFWTGERNKVHSGGGGGGFNNLAFDGGFGTVAPAQNNSGVTYPGTAASVSTNPNQTAWTNPNNAKVLDGVAATALLSGINNFSQLLRLTNFGFAIPANATILGIKAVATVKAGNNFDVIDSSVLILKNGVELGFNKADSTYWTTVFAAHNYGSSVDLWGVTWTPADINNANFGIDYSAASTATDTASVDAISIQVFYSVPGAAGLVPLGWTQGANFAGGDSALNKALPAYWGDAFAITGDGATAIRGQITQTAFQDYLQVPILGTNTGYGVRVRLRSANGLLQGTLHINLQSTSGGFTTSGLAVQASQLTGSYVEFAGMLSSALTSIPSDLVLQVYADGTPTNGGTFLVDCIEPYPLSTAINRTLVRASYAFQPEAFDGVTGQLIVGKDNGQAAKCMFKLLDKKLYIVKERSLYGTQDDGANEPSLWALDPISGTVGTLSVHGVDVAGESWAVIAAHDGLYIFWGAQPVKISQEIQPDWDTINWNAGQNLWVVVDSQNKRIHVGVPTGASTVPNQEFVMDYSQLNDAQDIAASPQAHYAYFNPSNIVAPGRARKWTIWNLSNNCGALTLRADGSYHLLRGNAAGNGKVYDQVATQTSDDGVAINSQYQTYYFPNGMEEQELQQIIGGHRRLFKFLTGYAFGSGVMTWSAHGQQDNRIVTLSNLTLANPAKWDFEKNVNFPTERASLILGTNAVGSWFHLSKVKPTITKDTMLVRGVA